jgi:methylated-DNA-[protein]-cysteine S-methyltransferase
MTTTATATTRHTELDTVLGPLTLVRDDDGLAGIYFPGHWTKPDRARFGPRDDGGGFADVAAQLTAYLAGERDDFDLPLAPAPTERAARMRAALLSIPYGTTTTYGALAAELGLTAREVGGLNAHNPISIVVPCHRVIGADGSLTGYAGGLERKQRLLDLEGAAPPGLW